MHSPFLPHANIILPHANVTVFPETFGFTKIRYDIA